MIVILYVVYTHDVKEHILTAKKGDKNMHRDTQEQTDFLDLEEEELSASQIWNDIMADWFPNAESEEELEEELENWLKD